MVKGFDRSASFFVQRYKNRTILDQTQAFRFYPNQFIAFAITYSYQAISLSQDAATLFEYSNNCFTLCGSGM